MPQRKAAKLQPPPPPHVPEADVQSLELEQDLQPDAPEPEAPEHLIDRHQEEEEIFVGDADI